eukprot:20294-Pleurochrysis_carterae.AAC.2
MRQLVRERPRTYKHAHARPARGGRRVVILLACVIIFRTPMTPVCMLGSAIAIIGSYFYSMAKSLDKVKKTAAVESDTESESEGDTESKASATTS